MKDLRVEVDGGVATLLIDRPQARNALATQTMSELDEALGSIQESGARVLVIRGARDRAFCAGGDLKELEHMRSETDAAEMAHAMRATLDRIPQLPLPVIAALNGDALGGGAELALACDFRVAASHARVGFAQVALGLIPAWGASERLAALVGRGRALYMLLSGATMSATEARERRRRRAHQDDCGCTRACPCGHQGRRQRCPPPPPSRARRRNDLGLRENVG